MAMDSIKSISNPDMYTKDYSALDFSTNNMNNTQKVNSSGTDNKMAKDTENKGNQTEENKKDALKGEASQEQIKSAISEANRKIRMTNTRCEFQYHEKTNRVSIKVIDKSTDEVVREIPPEKTLEMVEKMWELAGLFVDERR